MVFGPFRPFMAEEAEVLERETGSSLPESYRRFLEAAGGSLLEYAVEVPAGGRETELQSFNDLYRLGRNSQGEYGYGSLLGEYRHKSGWWPADEVSLEGLLPIARNGGSDTLFLDLNPATHGQLHAFVHGTPWPGYRQQPIFTKVAEDFDAYLDSLLIDPDMAQSVWEDVADSDRTDPWRRTVEEWLDGGMPGWRDRTWAHH